MASKKDMRRDDLGITCSSNVAKLMLNGAPVIPYREPTKDKNEGDMSSTMASTLPMAAVSTG